DGYVVLRVRAGQLIDGDERDTALGHGEFRAPGGGVALLAQDVGDGVDGDVSACAHDVVSDPHAVLVRVGGLVVEADPVLATGLERDRPGRGLEDLAGVLVVG